MFKVAKLKKVYNENINIEFITHQQRSYSNGEKKLEEKFQTLSFNISGDDYSLSFDLNCKLDKLLEIPMNETINFNDYIFKSETWFNVKEASGVHPEIDIKITRYLRNKFILFLTFSTDCADYNNDDYAGMIEFTFNLDDYLTDVTNTKPSLL